MLNSRPHLATRQTVVLSAMLLLAAFFISLDLLRTYWGVNITLSKTTDLILLWRILEPIIAATLAALSGLADWCRVRHSASGAMSEDNRSWVELGDVGNKVDEM